MLNKKILSLFLLLSLAISGSAQFHRGDRTVTINGEYVEVESKGIGLEKVLIFKNLNTATISFTTNKNKTVNFYTYENNIGDKDPFLSVNTDPPVGENITYTLSKLPDSKGLIIDDGQSLCIWIIDYSSHKPILNEIRPIESDDKCEILKLSIDKSDLLEYRGTGGQLRQIERKYNISYNIKEWSNEKADFEEITITEEDKVIGTEHLLSRVPNIDTHIHIDGDQFGRHFNDLTEKTTSEIYKAVAVEAHIVAKQQYRENSNEMGQDKDQLGGSAPVDIEFLGYGNKPVATFYTWLVYEKSNMNNPIARYTDQDFDYTFNQFGNYQVMLEVANAESTCVDTASVSFTITESSLDIPNYFSPGSTPGSNDEWRVAYKSLVKYKCTIFNRWGNKIFESTNPAEGWDGRYKGSLVHPGVYYYVIEATGSDGIKYKEGGDINILK